MTLLEMQVAFTRMVPRLIDFCFTNNYEVVLGEAYRPRETAQIYAAQGRGIKDSLHTDKLAIDLVLFINGNPLTQTESYRPIGEFWETLSHDAIRTCWGGRFNTLPDGGHFSVEWEGRK